MRGVGVDKTIRYYKQLLLLIKSTCHDYRDHSESLPDVGLMSILLLIKGKKLKEDKNGSIQGQGQGKE